MAGSAPSPWTPPADWPPMPAGLTEAQQASWIASMWQAQAIRDQTAAITAATASTLENTALQKQVLALLQASESAELAAVYKTLEIVHGKKP